MLPTRCERISKPHSLHVPSRQGAAQNWSCRRGCSSAAVQVYVYYELGKYYQNHKRYVRSRDDNQMAGKGSGSGKCAPEQYVGGNPDPGLPAQGAVTPCGLIAWSLFNDTFGDAASVVGPDGAPSSVPLDVSPSRALGRSLISVRATPCHEDGHLSASGPGCIIIYWQLA